MENSTTWTVDDATRLYQVDRWSQGFFKINQSGEVQAQLVDGSTDTWNLVEIVQSCIQQGACPPLLIRIAPIIRQRLSDLNRAFDRATKEFEYGGEYTCIYPIKVNQHREVIDTFVAASRDLGGGLEAGSKAELLAVIGLAEKHMPVLCSGFKDETVVEMALRATQLGVRVTIIIEQTADIELVARVSRRLNVRPNLGIRVKLAARSAGRWQTSVGSNSKFGLSAPRLVEAIRMLSESSLLENCHLLHFHPGSQMNNVRNIKACVIEATRIYADLVRRQVPLTTIDVGGGLAVDYTGGQNLHPSSMNYSLQEYANDVIYYIQRVCDEEQVPHPNVFSESGRALVAHHSVLVVPVIEALSGPSSDDVPLEPAERDELPLIELKEILIELNTKGNLQECYHDALHALEMAQQLFINGHLTMNQRAAAESLFAKVCRRIRDLLGESGFVPAELSELASLFTENYLANFSVFQSVPDHWALHHLFPLMPIHRLDTRPTCPAVVGDITCDSDGRIASYVNTDQPANSVRLHEIEPGQPYWLGVFLIGAYQEALGDDHNLMGKSHVAIVDVDSPAGTPTISTGSTLKDVLEHVHHDLTRLLENIGNVAATAAGEGAIEADTAAESIKFFRQCSKQYTYLDGDNPCPETAFQPQLPRTLRRNVPQGHAASQAT